MTRSIKIYRGEQGVEEKTSDVNIIIDVIRAFSLSHLAFLYGAKKIHLVKTVEEAFILKNEAPQFILTGEINGYPIDGFDMDNSPANLRDFDIRGKTLVQRTTNGVKAVLKCLQASYIFVTGFTCAKNTALHVKKLIETKNVKTVNIITSHPTGDDDFSCAEYIKTLILNQKGLSADKVSERIKNSEAAKKFFAPNNDIFNEDDIRICSTEIPTDFTMQIDTSDSPPSIRTVTL
jgi:2-phosphosulfolactate phosphatase